MANSITTQQQPNLPIVSGTVNLGGQTGAVSSTVIIASAPVGLYRFTVCVVVTVAGTSITVNAIYTDDAKAETVAVVSAASTAATGNITATAMIENSAVGNISFSTSGTTGTYNLYIIVERLF